MNSITNANDSFKKNVFSKNKSCLFTNKDNSGSFVNLGSS